MAQQQWKSVERWASKLLINPPARIATQRPLLFCALGGLLFALALPPWGLWPLAWLGLVPLWQVGIQMGNWRGSLAWAFLYEGITAHWLWDLHPLTWLGIPWGASLAIALACWLGIVVWRWGTILLWQQLTFRLGRGQSAGLRVLLGTALWLALEALWTSGPLYWDSFALSQSPHNLAILQLGRWGGAGLVSGAIVAVNGLVAEALASAHGFQSPAPAVAMGHQNGSDGARNRDPTGGRSRRSLWLSALGLWLGLHSLGGLIWLQSQGDPTRQAILPRAAPTSASPALAAPTLGTAPTLAIGLVQGNIPTRQKLTPAGIQLAIQRYAQGFDELANAGADAVLLPEGALPLVWSRDRDRFAAPLLGRSPPIPTANSGWVALKPPLKRPPATLPAPASPRACWPWMPRARPRAATTRSSWCPWGNISPAKRCCNRWWAASPACPRAWCPAIAPSGSKPAGARQRQ